LAAAFLVPLASSQQAAAQTQPYSARGSAVAYELSLPNGKTATVYADGHALIYSNAKDRAQIEVRTIPTVPHPRGLNQAGGRLPDKYKIMEMLAKEPAVHPYAPGWLVVVYREGVSASQETITVGNEMLLALRRAATHHATAAALPQYTSDARINRVLAELGVDRSERLFRGVNRSALSALRSGVQMPAGHAVLDFANAYKLHLTNASVPHAVQALLKVTEVAYVSPDWTVTAMHTNSVPLNDEAKRHALQRAQALRRSSLTSMRPLTQTYVPDNYGAASSLQSMLNAPSTDAIAAYDEIQRHFQQLPGQGEIITNVSIGDLDDASAASNSSDPCHLYATDYGPTTEILGAQRYINLPSLPLIPTYTADGSGNLNGAGEVCGVDPYDDEIDLDFTQMAPLPHALQRGGEQGSGLTDLVGIAPGAQYRLVVPSDPASTITDIQAALLGAAMQTPRPNVITASLGYGLDAYGFPGRFLEDDPLTEAIVASIVHDRIVVSIAANDGTRSGNTDAAIGPSGGSAPTNQLPPRGTPTNLNDIAYSTVPSLDFDSGSIAAGGTTLDDIFSNPPQYASNASSEAQHAYTETRWTGFTSFSSGFGSRVSLSAPSDNIIAFEHQPGGADDAVIVDINGGTSASSPEIAATAAVVQQVARLTGHPLNDPVKLRTFLEQSGSAVPPVSQADTALNVGPQIDVRRAVETLFEQGGVRDKPSVPRVAVEQRRNDGDIDYDGLFVSDTDPANIDLQHDQYCGSACADDADAYQWITIAPDWEFVSAATKYSLNVIGTRRALSTAPWARLLPGTILNAAGLPLASASSRTVKLAYTASSPGKSVSTTFSLTFGPADATSYEVLAPQVPAVVKGPTIAVTYDFSHVPVGGIPGPTLMVSEPGRIDGWTGIYYHPVYKLPLTASKGTVQVPVSALQGGGLYSVGIEPNAATGGAYGCYCEYAFTRVAPQRTDRRPAAPLLAFNGSTPGHYLDLPYNGTFTLSYDVSNVSGATGAALEISAAGPTLGQSEIYNPFNNPNGSERDDNGVDTGSIYFAPLSGTSGTITLSGKTAGLYSTMNHVVRVIPMEGGVAAGEAGDVSTITMDGVVPADGGRIAEGYGVNGNGLDGFITDLQNTASGQLPLSAIETFDQTTNAITQTVESGAGTVYFAVPFITGGGPGIYGSDVGLFGGLNVAGSPTVTYNLLNPVAAGTIGSSWTAPVPLSYALIDASAVNQANDNVAFLERAGSTFNVFTSQIQQNTSSLLYNISAPLQGLGSPPEVYGFAENTSSTGTAIAVGGGTVTPTDCGAPVIVTVNLASGAVGSFTGVQHGVWSTAVDSGTATAVIPTKGECDGGIGVYNLTSQTGFEITPPSFGSPNPPALQHFYVLAAADPVHHLFLVADLYGVTGTGDNNALSRIFVYDESGNLQKVISRVALVGGGFNAVAAGLQLNPAQRVGYIRGPGEEQLAPFNY
jgi:hypothetical protein